MAYLRARSVIRLSHRLLVLCHLIVHCFVLNIRVRVCVVNCHHVPLDAIELGVFVLKGVLWLDISLHLRVRFP